MPREHRTVASRGIAILTALLLALTGCSGDTELAPPKPSSTGSREAEATRLVSALAAAIRDGDAAAAASLAGPGAEGATRGAVANVQGLGLELLELRYLEPAHVEPAHLEGHPDDTWGATVEVVWQLPGWDRGPSHAETTLLLAPTKGGQRIVGFAPGAGRVPLWLTGDLEHASSPRVLVLHGGDAAQAGLEVPRMLRLGRTAVAQVSATLGWKGRLVIEVPDDTAQLEAAVAATQGAYDGIAAVTTTVDGDGGSHAPVHVFVNPGVFSKLGAQGAQVVMTHEAVHVAKDATKSAAPKWLREGFADYVALAHAKVPVRTAAAQAIERVRKEGAPAALPSDADLDGAAPGLGASYEEAWLVCRFIAREHGEPRLVDFYDEVDAGTTVPAALGSVLGTTVPDLTRAWRQDLERLAR